MSQREDAYDYSFRGPRLTDALAQCSLLAVGPELGVYQTDTHVVKHLALGGIVLLCDGVGHCIRAHEQRVPVVTADRQRQNREVRPRLNTGNVFSDGKRLRNELIDRPF